MLKKIFTNTLAQLVAKFFGAGLTLLTTYYTIRLAGLDLYGDLTKILILVAVGFTAIDFGLNAEGIRSAKNEQEMQQNLSQLLFARFFLSCFVLVILNLLILFLPGGYSPLIKSIFWLGSLAIVFQGIYASGNAWFQFKLSYWASTISVIIGSLVGTGLTLYFLATSPTLFNLVLANTIGYLALAICSILFLPRPFVVRCKLSAVTSTLRRSLILGAILIASVLASKIDTIILGIFRSSSEVGEYGFAYRIFDVILVLPVFVMNAIYPMMIILKDKANSLIKNTTKTMAIIGIFCATLLWFFAPYVSLVKPGLIITTTTLRLLSFSLPFFYMTAPLMWSLISRRKDKVVLGVYILATILNGTLNIFLIPPLGTVAAAINTGITELFIFLSLVYFSRKSN